MAQEKAGWREKDRDINVFSHIDGNTYNSEKLWSRNKTIVIRFSGPYNQKVKI